MNTRPINLKSHEVKAILDGRKKQTRRLLSIRGYKGFTEFGQSDTEGYDWHFRDKRMLWNDFRHDELLRILPYQVGNLLWVRESLIRGEGEYNEENQAPSIRCDCPRYSYPKYRADGKSASGGWEWESLILSSAQMPRWASRITLRVTNVRVERLQDISNFDARMEGVLVHEWSGYKHCGCDREDCVWCSHYAALYIPAFRHLWNSIHGDDAWDANPWVVAYTFEPIFENVDKVEASQ